MVSTVKTEIKNHLNNGIHGQNSNKERNSIMVSTVKTEIKNAIQ